MSNSRLNFKKPCVQCGNNTISLCKTCRRYLCGRCRSRKAIPFSKYTIPFGICKDCKDLLLIKYSLNIGLDFTSFLSTLPEKVEEW